MSFTLAYDVTARFFSQVPQGFQLAGYDTGSNGVPWTAAMWKAHPGAVHIDQDPGALSDVTADVLDVELGAVPVGSPLIARWVHAAQQAYAIAQRPGQRHPVIYCSASNVSANVNALVHGGVTSGAGLWIAKWDGNKAADIAALAAASGPFPVIGFQYADIGPYDADVFSTAWLSNVSGNAWVFGPCRSVQIWGGATTTFGVKGYAPGTPEPLGVGEYEIAVTEDVHTPFAQAPPAAGYPAYIPKTTTSAFSFTGHGVRQGVPIAVGVRALATDGHHAGPWVTATVTPGS